MNENTRLGDGLVARASPSGSAMAGVENGVYAALDLGTNNCRLLVARPASGGIGFFRGYSGAYVTMIGQ